MNGYPIHAERVVDGDASTLTAVTLFISGSTDERTLAATEIFYITGGEILTETAGDVALVADEAAAGKYIVFTKSAAGQHIPIPAYACPKGVVPKFSGHSSGRNSCILYGYIMEA